MHNFIFKKFRSIYFPVFLSKWIADFFLFLLCMIVYIYFEFSNIFKKSPSLLIQKEEVRAKLFNIYSPPSSKKKFVQNSADIKLSLRDKVELAIIVPFYNEAAFIEKCVSSALAQRTTFSFIVLAIDDGSTDHGAETLEEFKKFDNFFLIKQKNQGFSGARNIGIQLAKKYAKYLFFLDGDDYLFSNNSIDCLLTEALRVNADLVDGSYAEIRGYEKSYHKFNHVIKKNGISNEDIVLGYAWGRVMKVELWKDIYFPQNYWFEDTILNFFIIPKVKVYAAVDEIC
ncbi:glycosyl transferase family 2, partial [Oenococcus oeni]